MNARTARIAALLALTLVLVLALAGCSQSAAIKIDAPADGGSASSVGPTPVSMGQRAWSGDWSMVVTRTQRKGTVDGVHAGKGNQLLVVHFDVMNGSTRNGDVNVASFALTDEANAEIAPVLLESHKYVSNNPIAVVAGTKQSFTIVYRVGKGSGPFVWRFWPSVQGSQPKPAVLVVR